MIHSWLFFMASEDLDRCQRERERERERERKREREIESEWMDKKV
jgi:hypothetical protein